MGKASYEQKREAREWLKREYKKQQERQGKHPTHREVESFANKAGDKSDRRNGF